MAIPSKQIGWSQESNLLWEISKQMEKLTGVVFTSGGGGGGGGVNPTSTFMPYNDAGTFADSYIRQNGNIITTTFSGNDVGFNFDFNSAIYQLGDWNANSYLTLSNNTSEIYIVGGAAQGFYTIGSASRQTVMGDYIDNYNGTKIVVDDVNEKTTIAANKGTSLTYPLYDGYDVTVNPTEGGIYNVISGTSIDFSSVPLGSKIIIINSSGGSIGASYIDKGGVSRSSIAADKTVSLCIVSGAVREI